MAEPTRPDPAVSAPRPRRVLITGAAGHLGMLTVAALRSAWPDLDLLCLDRRGPDPEPGAGQTVPAAPAVPAPAGVDWQVGDVSDDAVRRRIDWPSIDSVIHLPALTTMPAEQDPAAAERLNIDSTLALLRLAADAGRARGRPLRFVFASSLGVFAGGEARVDEASAVQPASTYGFTTVVVEQYLAERSRRGEIDGACLRLPVCIIRSARAPDAVDSAGELLAVRPSAGFLSDLICELAAGRSFEAPMALDRKIPVASNHAAARALARLAKLPAAALPARLLHLPAVSASAHDAIDALRDSGIEVASTACGVRLNDTALRVTAGWPSQFETRHPALFADIADASLRAIVAAWLDSRSA